MGSLKPWRQGLLQLLTATAADGEAGAVFEQHHSFAFKQRVEFLDPIQINNRGAVNAEELVGRKFPFQLAHPAAQQMMFGPHVELDIIFGRFDPINLSDLKEDYLSR